MLEYAQCDRRLRAVGSGLESARETISLTNKCTRAGAQSALILTPFYYASEMTSGALIREVLDKALMRSATAT